MSSEPMKLQPFDRRDDLLLFADVKREGELLEFSYQIEGSIDDVRVPPPALPVRTNGLWQSTCFEAFISLGSKAYVELNFSPSGEWAAYRFSDYRQDMHELEIESPRISFAANRLVARVELSVLAGSALNLTAVIEHKSKMHSYWALAHHGNRPDFHAHDCFVARLP